MLRNWDFFTWYIQKHVKGDHRCIHDYHNLERNQPAAVQKDWNNCHDGLRGRIQDILLLKMSNMIHSDLGFWQDWRLLFPSNQIHQEVRQNQIDDAGWQ